MIPALLAVAAGAPSFGTLLDVRDLRGATVSALVTDLNGKTIFQRGSQNRVVPASNQKLFSVAYALDALGVNGRGKTTFVPKDDSLWIRSDGTLDVTYEQMAAIAKTLPRATNVYLAQSYRKGWDPTWNIGDAPNRYAPYISAFTCEKGGMELWLKDGQPELRPNSFGAKIVRPNGRGFSYDPFSGTVEVGGELTGSRRLDTLSQPNADLAAASLFGENVVRSAYAGDPPADETADAKVLFSPTVGEVAPRCLQPSDNFLAESLFEMAKVHGPTPEKWASSRVGLSTLDYDPTDGSGLSRRNYVTANGVARLLRWTTRQSWGALYRKALARPGVGTLRSRLAGVTFEGKTGSLTGVSSLSGFVRSSGGRTYVVSLIVNNFTCSVDRVHQIQDEFVRTAARR